MLNASWRRLIIDLSLLFISLLVGCTQVSMNASVPLQQMVLQDQNPITPPASKPLTKSPQGTLITGQTVNAGQQDIGPTGGKATVNKPGEALDGFTLDIPANSYTEVRTFKVSASPIVSHTFGLNFNPISPLISIDNGGGYSDRLVEVKVPVELPAGHFAMGFYYIEKTGKLEGISPLAVEQGWVTLAMTNFSNQFVISSVPEQVLQQEVSSGFLPGVDDWQFPNRGSYIAPWGHCSGQALTAMWYYHEKPDGSNKHLYGLYDNSDDENLRTPDLWVDDATGYKFASAIQVDYEMDIRKGKQAIAFFSKLARLEDKFTLYTFKYSMLMTGEPQYAEVWNFKENVGHALIVYRITAEGTLLVADPNYPGNRERKIEFASSKFLPYNSGSDVSAIQVGRGTAYDQIIYSVNTAMLPYPQIAARWQQIKNRAIRIDLFPSYSVMVYDNNGNALGSLSPNNDFITNKKMLKFGISPSNGFDITVYQNGAYVKPSEGKWELKPGNNRLGIAVWGNANRSPGVQELKWVNFEYYNVIYSES